MDTKKAYAEERDRLQFHILVALTQNPQARRLVLKGGTMLRMCVFPDYRFSEDLDFEWPGTVEELMPILEAAVEEACVSSCADIAFIDRGKGRRSADFLSLGMRGRIKIDVSELTETSPYAWNFQDNWENKDKNFRIMGHRLEMVAKEKFISLGLRAKGRDYYDLMRLDSLPIVCKEGWELYTLAYRSRTEAEKDWVAPEDLLSIMYEQIDEMFSEWEKSQEDYLIPEGEDCNIVFEHVAHMIEKNMKTAKS